MSFYSAGDGIKNIFRSKFISATIIISLALGLVFPMLVLCLGNSMIKEIKANMPYFPERTGAILTGNAELNTVEILANYSEIETVVKTMYTIKTLISNEDKNIVKSDVVGYGSGFPKQYKINMSQGKYFTDEEADGKERLCVITNDLSQKLSIGVGKSIEIKNNFYKIIGVSNSKNQVNTVYLPIECCKEIFENISFNYNILLKSNYKFAQEGLTLSKEILNQNSIKENNNIVAFENFYTNEQNQIIYGFTIMLLIAGIVFVYALLNIYNVIANKIKREQNNYKIRIQLGAKKGDIYLFTFIQLFVFIIAASAIDAVIIVVLSKFILSVGVFAFELNLLVILLIILIGAIFSAIMCCILTRSFMLTKRPKGGKR